ncbi:MAG: ABC transporter ATP-binding protein [Pseudomonadota bacterium]
MKTLSAQNISVLRGGKRVLHSLTTRLEPGTVTAICGPNGAGKSSLVMALAGLLEPKEGRVLLADAPLCGISARERACAQGYLPQGSDIAWNVSVQSLVGLGRYPHRDGASEQGRGAVESALAAAQLEELRDRPVSSLSGGERARALLARVLAGQPDWILADEPLAALDLAHQLKMIAHFRSCAGAGQGVVLVLHDLAIAMNHADRVIVLSEGEKIAEGDPVTALEPSIIARAWGVEADWLGAKGARALITRN